MSVADARGRPAQITRLDPGKRSLARISQCQSVCSQNILRCPGAELNHRHLHFQCSALPTELPGQAGGAYRESPFLCPDEGTSDKHASVRQRSARPSAKHIETRGSWGRAGAPAVALCGPGSAAHHEQRSRGVRGWNGLCNAAHAALRPGHTPVLTRMRLAATAPAPSPALHPCCAAPSRPRLPAR